MKQDLDFDRITSSWLEVGPNTMPDRALDAALDEIHKTRQIRFGALRRTTGVSTSVLRRAAAASLIVVVIGVAVLVATRLTAQQSTGQLPPVDGNAAPSPTANALGPLAPFGYPGHGTITFVRNDPTAGGDATWLVNPDGSNEARLRVPQPPAPQESDPYPVEQMSGTGCCSVFSPDGTQVALGYDFTGGWWQATGTWTATWIMGVDGSSISMVPRLCGGCGSLADVNFVPRAWSPDGTMIAIETWNDSDPHRNGINLASTCSIDCTIGPGAQTCGDTGCLWQEAVTGEYRDVPVAFSPDSKKLLFIRIDHDNQGALMVLSIPSGILTQLSADGMLVYSDGYFGPAASWSPDGTRVAFAATDTSGSTAQMSAYVVPVDGGTPVRIAGPTPYLTSARWSPDGKWIAFDRLPESAPAGRHDLFIVHPDGSGTADLTSSFDPGICCGRWSPDSTALLAAGTAGPDNQSNLFIVPIDGSQIYQVTDVPGSYTDYSWGPASR